jgi:hypothetical protein
MLKISYTSYKEKYHSLQHNLISCHTLSHFIDAIMVWLILKALQLMDCKFFFFVLCLLYHMLRIIMGCPLCIVSSVYPNVYLNANIIGNAWIWKSTEVKNLFFECFGFYHFCHATIYFSYLFYESVMIYFPYLLISSCVWQMMCITYHYTNISKFHRQKFQRTWLSAIILMTCFPLAST